MFFVSCRFVVGFFLLFLSFFYLFMGGGEGGSWGGKLEEVRLSLKRRWDRMGRFFWGGRGLGRREWEKRGKEEGEGGGYL